MSRRESFRWFATASAMAVVTPGFCAGAALSRPRASAADAGQLGFMHIRQSTFLVGFGTARVLIDPWFSTGLAPSILAHHPPPAVLASKVGSLDAIVVTQCAPDRVDSQSIRALVGRTASCFVPDERTAAMFRRAGYRRVRVVRASDRFDLCGGHVRFSPAPDGLFSTAQVGAHFTIGGRSLWHTASPPPLVTDAQVADFAKRHPAEVVLGCASGWNVGDRAAFMSEEDAIAIASLAKARYLVPHSTDVEPTAIGRLFVTKRNEVEGQRMVKGPVLHRAPRGKWTIVARQEASEPRFLGR